MANVFGHMKQYVKCAEVITNGKIKGTYSIWYQTVGRAVHFKKSNCVARVLPGVMDLHACALCNFSCEVSNGTLVQHLMMRQRCLYKVLFDERSKEILSWAHWGDRLQIAATLKSGLTQGLIQSSDFISFPLALNDLEYPEKLICDPEGVKSMRME